MLCRVGCHRSLPQRSYAAAHPALSRTGDPPRTSGHGRLGFPRKCKAWHLARHRPKREPQSPRRIVGEIAFGPASEAEPGRQLSRARRTRARNHSEIARTQSESGNIEYRMVQQIVILASQVEFEALG